MKRNGTNSLNKIFIFLIGILIFIGCVNYGLGETGDDVAKEKVKKVKVEIDTSDAYISAYPKTLVHPGYVDVNVKLKNYDGMVDVVIYTNNSKVKAKGFYFYNDTKVEEEYLLYVCDGILDIKNDKFDCELTNGTVVSGKFDRYEDNRFYSNYTREKGWQFLEFFASIDEKTWVIKDLNLSYNKNYRFRYKLDFPAGIIAKYDIGFVPSSIDVKHALKNYPSFILDPFIDSTGSDAGYEYLEDYLIAAYNFDDSEIIDVYRGIYNGSVNGGNHPVSGNTTGESISGGSLYCYDDSSTGNNAELPSFTSEMTAPYSIVVWVYKVTGLGDSLASYIWQNQQSGPAGNILISTSTVYYKYLNPDIQIASNVTATFDTWEQHVYTCDGNVAKLYLNGEIVAQSDNSSCGWVNKVTYLCMNGHYTNPRGFGGYLDNLMFFNKTLNSTEIKDFYDNEIMFNITVGNSAPTLTNANLSPLIGNVETIFYYNVTYTDAENDNASYVYVTIDGTNYSMDEYDPSDTNVTDGKVYNYSINGTTLGVGNHSYYFIAADEANMTVNTTNYTGPTVTNVSFPKIYLYSPENKTYTYTNILLNYFYVESNPSWMGYSLNGNPNVTLPLSFNSTFLTTFNGSSTSIVSEGLDGSLIGYYGLEEAIGTTTYDSTDNNINGNLDEYYTGIEYGQAGKVNNGYYFNSSGFVDFGNNMAFERTDNFSVFFWVKFNGTNPLSNQYIVAKQNTNGKGWGIAKAGATISVNLINYFFSPYNRLLKYADFSTNNITYDEWHHIGFTYTYNGSSSANDTIIYVDGQVANQYVGTNGDTLTSSILNPTTNFTIGARANGQYLLKGDLDEVGIWNRTLTPSEVADLYNNGNGMPYVGDANITFYFANQSITKYLDLPANASVISAVMNLSGENSTATSAYCYQETANTSDVDDGACGLNYTGAYGYTNNYFYINYTKPDNVAHGSIWQVQHGNFSYPYNITLPQSCFDYSNNSIILRMYSDVTKPAQYQKTSHVECYNGTWNTIGTPTTKTMAGHGWITPPAVPYIYDGIWTTGAFYSTADINRWDYAIYIVDSDDTAATLFEEAMIWNVTTTPNYPANVSITINGTSIFDYNGTFTTSNEQTIDFADELNSYLYSCLPEGCDIPIVFTSESPGAIAVTNLTVNYYEQLNITAQQGHNNITLYMNDSVGNLNSTTTLFYVDSINPIGNLTSPPNDTYSANTSYNFTGNLTDEGGLDNATLYIYNSSGDLYNQTTTVLSGVTQKLLGTVVTVIEGTYTWFYKLFDTLGNVGFTSQNFTLTVDTSSPKLTINSPISGTSYNASEVIFNVTGNEQLINCSFNLGGGTNYTMTNETMYTYNYTNSSIPDGTYTAYFSCTNLVNLTNNTESSTFVIDTNIPKINYTDPTPSTGTNQSFDSIFVNVTWNDTSPDVLAFRLYNETGLYDINIQNISLIDSFFDDFDRPDGNVDNNWTVYEGVANDIRINSNKLYIYDNSGTYNSYIQREFKTTPLNVSFNWRPGYGYLEMNLSDGPYIIDGDSGSYNVYNGSTPLKVNYSTGVNQYDTLVFANVNFTSETYDFYLNGTLIYSDLNFRNSVSPTIFRFWTGGAETTDSFIDNFSIVYNDNNTNDYYNFTNIDDGIYWFNVTINDTAGNSNSTETRRIVIDTLNPNVSLVSPPNLTNTTNTSFNFTVNVNDSGGIKNATLYIYNETGDLYNSTLTEFAGGVTQKLLGIVVTIVDGTYTWFYNVFDWVDHLTTSGNFTLTVDTIGPEINYSTGTAVNYANLSQNYIFINVTWNETNPDAILFHVWNSSSSFYGINTNIDGLTSYNYTFSSLKDGQYSYNATLNDTAGSSATAATKTITLDTTNPLITIVSPQNTTYTNNTTSFIINVTDVSPITLCKFTLNNWLTNYTMNEVNSSTWNYTNTSMSDGHITAQFWCNDSANNINATESIQFEIDSDAPIVNITSPGAKIDYHKNNTNYTFEWTIYDLNADTCFLEYDLTNYSINCTNGSKSLVIDNYDMKNATVWANDTYGNINLFTRNWTYKVYERETLYNNYTYEGDKQTFAINVSSDGAATVSPAYLYYNNTYYQATKSGDNSNMIFSRTIDIPLSGPDSKNFSWSIYYNGSSINTTYEYNQTIIPIHFIRCNTSIDDVYANFTFKDASNTSQRLNATTVYANWVYWINDSTYNQSYNFVNNTPNLEYDFCFSPPNRTLYATVDYRFESSDGSGYPARIWGNTSIIIPPNYTYNQTLWLLSNLDGQYVTFTVTDTTGAAIEGASVSVTRVLEGETTQVAYAETDATGRATFWLDSGTAYTIYVNYTGCNSATFGVVPSETSYVISLACTGDYSVGGSSNIEGVRYSRSPITGAPVGIDNITFEYYVASLTYDILKAKFEIYYVNGTYIAQNESIANTAYCNATRCYLTLKREVAEGDVIKARYYVAVNNTLTGETGYILLEGDARWYFIETAVKDVGTIRSVFTNLRDLFTSWQPAGYDPITGWNYTGQIDCTKYTTRSECESNGCFWDITIENQTEYGSVCYDRNIVNRLEYSRIVFIFLALAIILAIFGRITGYDAQNPGAFLIVIIGILAIGTFANGIRGPGFFYYSNLTPFPIFNNLVLLLIVGIFGIGYYISTLRRYT